MMSKTDGDGFRKTYRTNADGSKTMLKTRGGWPQFETVRIDPSDVNPWVPRGVLQAFAVPYANLTTELGEKGYTFSGNFYSPSPTSTSDKRWFSDTRELPAKFKMRRMQQLGLLDWFDGRTGTERNPRVVTWNNNLFGGRNAATCSRRPLTTIIDFQDRYEAPGITLAEFSVPSASTLRSNTPNVFVDGKGLTPMPHYIWCAGAVGETVVVLTADDTIDLYAHVASEWVKVASGTFPLPSGDMYFDGFFQTPFMNGSCTEAKGIARFGKYGSDSDFYKRDHVITVTLPSVITVGLVETITATLSPATSRMDRKPEDLATVVVSYAPNSTNGVYDSPVTRSNGMTGSEIIDVVAVDYKGDTPVMLRKGSTGGSEYFAEATVSPGEPYTFSLADKYSANVALINARAAELGMTTLTGVELWSYAKLVGSSPEQPQEVVVQLGWSGTADSHDWSAVTPHDIWSTKWFDTGPGSDKFVLSATLDATVRERVTQAPEFIDPVVELVEGRIHFPEHGAFEDASIWLWRITSPAEQNENRVVTTLVPAEAHFPTEVVDIEQCDLRHDLIVTVTKTSSDPLNGGDAELHFGDYEGETISWVRPIESFSTLPGGAQVPGALFPMGQTMGAMSWMTVHPSGQHVVYGRPADGTAKHLHYATPSSDVELVPPFAGSRYVAPIFYREKIKEAT